MKALLIPTLLLAACKTAPKPTAEAPENVAPTRLTMGYVLVTRGAFLRSAPHADAPGARAQPLNGAPSDDANLEQVWVVRQIADEGDWVEIENLTYAEAEPHCYGSVGALQSMKLRLHVRRADLVPVTTHVIEAGFDDGSGVDLAAGVAMGRDGDRFRIGVDGLHPVVSIDASDVGTSYLTPTARLDERVDAARFVPVPPGPFMIDGQEVDLPSRLMSSAVIEEGPDANHQLVTVAMSCSRYHGVVEKQDYGAGWGVDDFEGVGMSGSHVYDQPGVRAGAALTWADGTPAGETLEHIDVSWPEQVGDRMCFQWPLRGEDQRPEEETGQEEWFLTLCAEEPDYHGGFGA